MSLLFDRFLVFVQLVIGNGIERILRVRCLVHRGVVLVPALDDTLGSGSHEDDVVTGGRNVGVLHPVCLVPGYALEDVRLRSGRNLVSPPVVLNLHSDARAQ